MDILNKDIFGIFRVLQKAADTNHPLHRVKLARAINKVKTPAEEYEFAIRPSSGYRAYEFKQRQILEKYGRPTEVQGNAQVFVFEGDSRDKYDSEISDLMSQNADVIAQEYDRRAEVDALSLQVSCVPLLPGEFQYSWFGGSVTGNDIALLMGYGLIDERSIDSEISKLEIGDNEDGKGVTEEDDDVPYDMHLESKRG